MRNRTSKQDRQYLVGLLLAVAVLSVAFLVAHGVHFYLTGRRVPVTPKSLTADEPNEATVKAYLAPDFNSVAKLKKSNLYAPAPPKRNPVAAVQGIMGQSALINNKWYNVGDKIQDAKVVAIESTLVTIEWEGKESTFAPNGGMSGGPAAGPAPGPPGRPSGPRATPGPMPTGGPIPNFTPEDMARLQRLSPEERNAALAQMATR